MIYRMIPTSFDVLPKKNGTYLLAYHDGLLITQKDGEFNAYSFTTEGGWNTHVQWFGEVYKDSAMSIDEMKDSYKYWLRPVEVEGDSFAERLATLLDEVTAEKNSTEPTEGEDIGKFEKLDELETHIMHALEFAEDLDR